MRRQYLYFVGVNVCPYRGQSGGTSRDVPTPTVAEPGTIDYDSITLVCVCVCETCVSFRVILCVFVFICVSVRVCLQS